MKSKYLFIILFSSIIGLQAAINKRLVGVWELTEFKMVQKGKEIVSDEKVLRNTGAIWNIEFSEDGSFKQNFNMRNAGKKMEIEEGRWSTVNDSLFVELQQNTKVSKLSYTYIFLGDVIVLSLENPLTTDKIITRFRRK